MATKVNVEQVLADHTWQVRHLKKGTRVYVNIRRVSQSGMSRVMSWYVIDESHNDLIWLDSLMLDLGIGARVKDSDGLRVSGCGMDMAWYSVYRLSEKVLGDPDALTARVI